MPKFRVLFTFCKIFSMVILQIYANFLDVPIPEEALADVPYLISKAGYPVETYSLKTKDGYFLRLHRIPHGKSKTNQIRPVVLLVHGICSGSQDWIIIGPKSALGYFLADNGYDVWLGNYRGNYYSRKHVSLNPDKDHRFWNYTLHEIGFYDIPALIDKVIEISGSRKIHYIGHSQGCAAFFIMLITRKEYKDKILSMNAYAPAVYFSDSKIPSISFFQNNYLNIVDHLRTLLTPSEFSPRVRMNAEYAYKYCQKTNSTFTMCYRLRLLDVLGATDGYNLDDVPLILSHSPCGASSKNVFHLLQFHKSGSFHQYDYGATLNKIAYGEHQPPKYDLGAVDVPVYIWYGKTDILFNKNDMDRLFKELGNGISNTAIDSENFNHIDFVFSPKAINILYKPTLDVMNKYNKKY